VQSYQGTLYNILRHLRMFLQNGMSSLSLPGLFEVDILLRHREDYISIQRTISTNNFWDMETMHTLPPSERV